MNAPLGDAQKKLDVRGDDLRPRPNEWAATGTSARAMPEARSVFTREDVRVDVPDRQDGVAGPLGCTAVPGSSTVERSLGVRSLPGRSFASMAGLTMAGQVSPPGEVPAG